MKEATALGAVILAGLAVGVWKSEQDIQMGDEAKTFLSTISAEERRSRFACWKRAVGRSLNLAENPVVEEHARRPDSSSFSQRNELDMLHPLNLVPILSGAIVFGTFTYLLLRRL